MCTSKFPAQWKIARVLPLLKSSDSDKTNPSSYQPVSQLPIISKLTEHSIQTQILKYLEETKQLHVNHHAYRSRHSTSTALIQLMDLIVTATDGNLITTSLSLDLSAAFDCVEHSILLDKLAYYGLDNGTLKWIKSYLSFRSSFVAIGSSKSIIKPSPHGVPQGSCMGPLLYLNYVNEMPTIMEDEHCPSPVHKKKDTLFPSICNQCGVLPTYADEVNI